jgi:S-adenosylmethionine hydrolase
MAHRLVTVSADFGPTYGAQVKAMLYRRVPPGHVVELDLELPPHGIEESAFLLRHMAARFPAGTVHLAVVDPGVGSSRAAVALESADGSYLVGPDNGLLVPLALALGGIRSSHRLDPSRVADDPRAVSATFEGRDLFAPAAARLATGASPSDLGPPHPDLVRLSLPDARRTRGSIVGRIAHIDRFGNLISNIPGDWVAPGAPLRARLGSERRTHAIPRARTYSELAPGALGALVSSFGLLELSAREASAACRLRARVGASLELWPGATRPTGPRRGRLHK